MTGGIYVLQTFAPWFSESWTAKFGRVPTNEEVAFFKFLNFLLRGRHLTFVDFFCLD